MDSESEFKHKQKIREIEIHYALIEAYRAAIYAREILWSRMRGSDIYKTRERMVKYEEYSERIEKYRAELKAPHRLVRDRG